MKDIHTSALAAWENRPKHYLPRDIVALLGFAGTAILAHILFSTASGSNSAVIALPDGSRALRQSVENMAAFLRISPHTIRDSLDRLQGMRLITAERPPKGWVRSKLWTINHSQLDRLLRLSDAYWQAQSFEEWEAWEKDHPGLSKMFADLIEGHAKKRFSTHSRSYGKPQIYDRDKMTLDHTADPRSDHALDHTADPRSDHALDHTADPRSDHALDHTADPRSDHTANPKCIKRDLKKKKELLRNVQTSSENGDHGNLFFPANEDLDPEQQLSPVKKDPDQQPRPKKQDPDQQPRPDKYIEHWNQQPHVPKCRIGTKAYNFCRNFFKAHKKYAVGTNEWFFSDLYKTEIQLDVINAEKDLARGTRPPTRPDEEMYEHIELAAKAFDPECAPQNKQYLGRSLQGFLYNSYSATKGQTSRFLQCIANPPRRLDDVTALFEKQGEPQQYVIEHITKIFNSSRGRPQYHKLDDAELRTAIQIAHNILAEFVKIPRRESDTLMYFFPDYVRFVNMWAERVIEMVWDGMPINALNVGKSLWTKFIDQIQDELNRDIFTGERL